MVGDQTAHSGLVDLEEFTEEGLVVRTPRNVELARSREDLAGAQVFEHEEQWLPQRRIEDVLQQFTRPSALLFHVALDAAVHLPEVLTHLPVGDAE